jgi:hypothetical protein
MDENSASSAIARALVELAENFGPVVEAVSGYKRKWIEAGFSEGAAETLASEYHGIIIAMFKSTIK